MQFVKRPALRHGPQQQTMTCRTSHLEFSGSQIVSFRRRVGSLDERLPAGPQSLRRAAWAGLRDSVPRRRAAVDPCPRRGHQLSQLGAPVPRPALGPAVQRLRRCRAGPPGILARTAPDDPLRRARAHDTSSRLHAFLEGRRMPFGKAGHAMGVQPNGLRYAAPTGTVVLRWTARISRASAPCPRPTWIRGTRASSSRADSSIFSVRLRPRGSRAGQGIGQPKREPRWKLTASFAASPGQHRSCVVA
jgi:hypothetical protein